MAIYHRTPPSTLGSKECLEPNSLASPPLLTFMSKSLGFSSVFEQVSRLRDAGEDHHASRTGCMGREREREREA